jgi:hypothetical protein
MKKQNKQKIVKGLPLFSLDSCVVPMHIQPEIKKGAQKNEDGFNSPQDK